MQRREFKLGKPQAARLEAEVSNVRYLTVNGEEMSSPFASLGYKPDNWKAYLEFDICHALPSYLGPVAPGNYVGFYPQTLAASHESLLHQQLNLRHLIKAYDPKNITQDRIVGCVVATYFPKAPMTGWKVEGSNAASAPCIRAMAVVFKLAQGVNATMGDHLASRKKQSVSIETTTQHNNLGVYTPSKGLICTLLDPTDEVLEAMTKPPEGYSTPILGKVGGEQLVLVYGLDGKPIEFQGVGMTPNPAERRAKISNVRAEEAGQELVGIAAEAVTGALVGKCVRFDSTHRVGRIVEVCTQGRAKIPGNAWSMKASEENPVLRINFANGDKILRRLHEVAQRIA